MIRQCPARRLARGKAAERRQAPLRQAARRSAFSLWISMTAIATGCRLSLPNPSVASSDSRWLRAPPGEEISRSNVWRLVSCSIRRQQVGQAVPAEQTSVGVWGSAKRSGASPSRGGSAALQSAGNPADSQNSGTPMYGSRIRRQDARQQVAVGPADRQRRPSICGEVRRFEEISRSNVWRLISCAVRRQQVAVGPADRQRRPEFSGISGKPKKLGTPIYGPQFRVLSGGSKWVQAQPAGSRWLRAPPGEEISRSNVWRLVSCSIRRQQVGQAVPAGQTSVGVWGSAKRSGASPSQTESAMPTRVFRNFRKTEEIGDSNLWSPISCSIRR